MGVLVFLRQYLLDRELLRLLNHSRESFDNLKRLQAQILQSEKLASIGQLVGGAAHELNNPITAMLGYSDMLLSTASDSRTTTDCHEDRPVRSPYQVSGCQPDQLCPTSAGAQESPRSQHPGAHRREADPIPMESSRDRSAHPVRSRSPQGFGRLQPVAAGLSATGGELPARAQRTWRSHANGQHRTTGGKVHPSYRYRTRAFPARRARFHLPNRSRRWARPERMSRNSARAPRQDFA